MRSKKQCPRCLRTQGHTLDCLRPYLAESRDIAIADQMVEIAEKTGMLLDELAVVAARSPELLAIAHRQITKRIPS